MPMKRLIELDILRGVLLLMMVVNHAPSPLRVFTDQPIGFFSTRGICVRFRISAGLLFQRRTENRVSGGPSSDGLSGFPHLPGPSYHPGLCFVVGGVFRPTS